MQWTRAHVQRLCMCTQRSHKFIIWIWAVTEWSQMQNYVGDEHLQPLWYLEHQIVYCTPYMMGWIGSNAGFQQQFEQQIQSGGRTVSTAASGIQTKELHSSWKNQETPPHISIVPVHMDTEAHKMGNGSHCSQTAQKVSTPCILLIRKIKITYQDKERTRKKQ